MEKIKDNTKEVVEQVKDATATKKVVEKINDTAEKEKAVENAKETTIEKEDETNATEDFTVEEVKKQSKIWIILVIIAILVVFIAIFSTIFVIINIKNVKILKDITIGTINVSNLTQEEAIDKLENEYGMKTEKNIYLKHGEYETSVTYEALEVKYQIEKAVQQAYSIGRDGNVFQNNFEILKTMRKGRNIELEVTLDKDMISQIAQNINNSIEDSVVQPSYYVEKDKGKLVITAGKQGVKVDEEKLLEEIYKVLYENTSDDQKIDIPMKEDTPEQIDIDKIHNEVYKEVKDAYYTQNPFTVYPEEEGIDFGVEAAKTAITEEKEEYEIPLKITKPSKTVKDIGTEAFPDLISTFSTKYNAGNADRTTNLRLAANKINGTVLLPNEEFSYNAVVGERTINAGYKMAATYSNGAVVDGLGGGICQISSTLYDAVVMANLKITTRRNHQFVTSYVPAGKDATVVWGSQDFKFVNSRKYPVRITASVQGGVATVQVWGIKEDVEYDISIETKKTATIAYTTQYINDSSLPVGTQKVVQNGNNGSKYEAYKVKRLNGEVVSRTLLSKDTYNAMQKIVRVGTGN